VLFSGGGACLAIAALALARPWSQGRQPQRLAEEARELARAGRFQEADHRLKALLRQCKPDPSVHLIQAQVAAGLGETDRAIAALREIPDDDPLGPLARLSEGQLEARRGRLRPAEAAFLATLRILPECVPARRELVYIYSVQQRIELLDEQLTGLSSSSALDRKHLIHWGMVRHSSWSAAADLPALRRYTAADPHDRYSRLALTDALIRIGQLEEAATAIAPFPESDPDAAALRARIAEARHDTAELERILNAGATDHPGLAALRGRRALANRDAVSAAEHFRRVLRLRPHDRAALAGLAAAQAMAGEKLESERSFAKLREIDALGALLARAEAAQDQLEPSLARELGLACLNLGRHAEAEAWLRQTISLNPADAEAQRLLARLSASSPPTRPRSE